MALPCLSPYPTCSSSPNLSLCSTTTVPPLSAGVEDLLVLCSSLSESPSDSRAARPILRVSSARQSLLELDAVSFSDLKENFFSLRTVMWDEGSVKMIDQTLLPGASSTGLTTLGRASPTRSEDGRQRRPRHRGRRRHGGSRRPQSTPRRRAGTSSRSSSRGRPQASVRPGRRR